MMEREANEYPFEDIRAFMIKRTFLVEDEWRKANVISADEYQGLKARTLQLADSRSAYLRAFIDGWVRAKS